jgi:hypothetical protein
LSAAGRGCFFRGYLREALVLGLLVGDAGVQQGLEVGTLLGFLGGGSIGAIELANLDLDLERRDARADNIALLEAIGRAPFFVTSAPCVSGMPKTGVGSIALPLVGRLRA